MRTSNRIACAAIALVVASAASADVVISNFSAGVGVGTAFGSGSTTMYKAYGFLMGDTAHELDAVVLSMNFSSATAPLIEVSIWSGATSPDVKLITLDNPAPLSGQGDFSFTPPSTFTLEAGESYWVYVSPVTTGAGDSYTWDGSSPSTDPFGPAATTIGYIFNGSPSTFRNRLEVQGTPADACYADCDGSGTLDFFDFLCFQNAFAQMDPYADCDGSGTLDFFDFLCFQNEFAAGCP
ncbi:MAG: choice-of-anchor R domain-containing protein [Phycisphaerales bacterium JB039]